MKSLGSYNKISWVVPWNLLGSSGSNRNAKLYAVPTIRSPCTCPHNLQVEQLQTGWHVAQSMFPQVSTNDVRTAFPHGPVWNNQTQSAQAYEMQRQRGRSASRSVAGPWIWNISCLWRFKCGEEFYSSWRQCTSEPGHAPVTVWPIARDNLYFYDPRDPASCKHAHNHLVGKPVSTWFIIVRQEKGVTLLKICFQRDLWHAVRPLCIVESCRTARWGISYFALGYIYLQLLLRMEAISYNTFTHCWGLSPALE
jgi:hypothetical protein